MDGGTFLQKMIDDKICICKIKVDETLHRNDVAHSPYLAAYPPWEKESIFYPPWEKESILPAGEMMAAARAAIRATTANRPREG